MTSTYLSTTKPCLQCGVEFRPRAGRNNPFCSSACYGRFLGAAPTEHICEYCSASFVDYPSRGRRFCSSSCKNRAASTPIPVKICEACGEPFTAFSHQAARAQKYCSHKCQGKTLSVEKVDVECATCGAVLKVFPSRAKQSEHHYCSRKCKRESNKHLPKGEQHHNWKGGGIGGYRGAMWTRNRRLARKRDKNTCQHCGTAEGYLSVHHIVPWRVSHDSSLKNLVTLCGSCHMKAEYQYWRDNPAARLRLDLR
jgi:5-methylcytosine-specific restriction endonuclease McrA